MVTSVQFRKPLVIRINNEPLLYNMLTTGRYSLTDVIKLEGSKKHFCGSVKFCVILFIQSYT